MLSTANKERIHRFEEAKNDALMALDAISEIGGVPSTYGRFDSFVETVGTAEPALTRWNGVIDLRGFGDNEKAPRVLICLDGDPVMSRVLIDGSLSHLSGNAVNLGRVLRDIKVMSGLHESPEHSGKVPFLISLKNPTSNGNGGVWLTHEASHWRDSLLGIEDAVLQEKRARFIHLIVRETLKSIKRDGSVQTAAEMLGAVAMRWRKDEDGTDRLVRASLRDDEASVDMQRVGFAERQAYIEAGVS